ncbi:MAG: MOSC domain-containing protein [Pseudomonadota bacterium]
MAEAESQLHALTRRWARPGRVEWIAIRPARRAPMTVIESARALGGRLEGDHASAGKRGVTFLQHEHLAPIARYLGRSDLPPEELRRNIVVSGLNLAALKARSISIGSAVFEITGICAPCSRMEEALGHGGYSAVRGHGGWCGRVVQPGEFRLGDPVRPL